MFFRNLVWFVFPQYFPGLFSTPVADEFSHLDSMLDECRLKEVGPLELSSRGFISPFGRDSDVLTHSVDGDQHVWIAIGGEEKILPPAVINDLLAKKLAELEEREGRKPGGRTRKRLREELVQELLPRAFVAPSRIDAYFDKARGLIAVDTSSRRTGESVVSEVRRAIGSFPALPLNAEVAPRSVMTGWLAGDALPEGLSLGDECELRDPADSGSVVRCQHLELQSDEIAKHLEAGKQVTRLALVLRDRLSFVFGEDLTVRKLRFLDGAVDSLESMERDDLRAELDARFTLMVAEVGQLFDVLKRAFKFSDCSTESGGAPASPPPPKNRQTRRTPPLDGITSVTISAGGHSVTMSGEQFHDVANMPKVKLREGIDRFKEARDVVVSSGNTSIAHLQRVLKVGYNAAARLIDALEAAGIVSSPDRTGKRELLVKEPVA